MRDSHPDQRPSRRNLLQAGMGLASIGAAGSLPGCVTAGAAPGRTPANPALEALGAQDPLNGGAAPVTIPWLDKNGSHNQMPGPGVELSNIFHFKGRIARANDFTGMGTGQDGERISFGLKSTDFSFMRGEYFAGRQARQGCVRTSLNHALPGSGGSRKQDP
jgi:hypothetical protein